jgi:hypothetical protein
VRAEHGYVRLGSIIEANEVEKGMEFFRRNTEQSVVWKSDSRAIAKESVEKGGVGGEDDGETDQGEDVAAVEGLV